MAILTANKPLTEKSAAALAYLQANDNGEVGYTGKDLAEGTGLNAQGIHGIMKALVTRGFVAKGTIPGPFASKDGTTGIKEYTSYFLTEEGRGYVIG